MNAAQQQHRPDETLGLTDIARVLRRHIRKSFVTFVLLFAACVGLLIVLPRTFESEALLFVRVGRESVTLDPTVTTGQTLMLNESRESEMNSIIEVLESRRTMEKVVDVLGDDVVLNGMPGEPVEPSALKKTVDAVKEGLGTVSQWLEPTGPISSREKAVQTVMKNCHVSNTRKSNVIAIRYRAKTPEQAQLMAKTISDVYLQMHHQINRTPGSYDFFVGQAEMFSDKLEAARTSLRSAKNEMQLASIDGKRKMTEARVQELQGKQQAAQTALATSHAKIASLEALIARLPDRVNSQQVEGMPNLAGDHMRQQLFQLEIQEKELRSKYTEDHPQVVAIQRQLDEAKRIQKEQAPSRTYSTTAVNPTKQTLQQTHLAESAVADSLEAQLASLDQQLVAAISELRNVNRQEQELDRLQRDANLAETNYYAYAEKLEQARIERSLDEQNINNITSMPATFVEKPTSPKKSVFLAASFLFSCLGALAVALFSELKNRRLRSPEEVESQLGLPIVVAIPSVSHRRILSN